MFNAINFDNFAYMHEIKKLQGKLNNPKLPKAVKESVRKKLKYIENQDKPLLK